MTSAVFFSAAILNLTPKSFLLPTTVAATTTHTARFLSGEEQRKVCVVFPVLRQTQ